MPIVACPCGKRFRAIDSLAGKQINCPGCGRPLRIPETSLLDEELARPARPTPVAASTPRSRIGQRSTASEAWLLAVLLGGAGVVLLAIVATMMSMLSGSGDSLSDDQETSAGVEDTTTAPALGELAAATHEPPHEASAPESTPNDTPDSSIPAVEKPAPNNTADIPSAPEPEEPTVEPPAAPPAERPPRTDSTPPKTGTSGSAGNTIRLSSGVALAQTLPTGTAMGFSVDYQFNFLPTSLPANLVWVIESGKGQTIRQAVRMNATGTLQGFTPLRPEHGPFQTHIEDPSGYRLSKSIPLN